MKTRLPSGLSLFSLLFLCASFAYGQKTDLSLRRALYSRIVFTCATLALLFTFITMKGFGQVPTPQAFAAFDQGAYTPPKASAERKAILDAYREARKQPGEDATKAVVFVVGYMKVHRGWVWITVNPQSPSGDQQYESESALLHKEDGQWKLKARQSSEEGDEDSDDKQFFRKLKTRFPSMPPDILPQ